MAHCIVLHGGGNGGDVRSSSARVQSRQKAAPVPKTPSNEQGPARARGGTHQPRQAHMQESTGMLPEGY
ncbi:hypothetical protein L3X38_034603 [Prunus dulcis]|uniref:Uncharacterized protein n=1 Tax=Prunus dulcis TaxID=3755 RepID=A0AAD4VI32_PRUDU|nr:hypothetical protein L3X38_034603 [Prunus dulcis]